MPGIRVPQSRRFDGVPPQFREHTRDTRDLSFFTALLAVDEECSVDPGTPTQSDRTECVRRERRVHLEDHYFRESHPDHFPSYLLHLFAQVYWTHVGAHNLNVVHYTNFG